MLAILQMHGPSSWVHFPFKFVTIVNNLQTCIGWAGTECSPFTSICSIAERGVVVVVSVTAQQENYNLQQTILNVN